MRILFVEDDKKLAGYLEKGLVEEQYAVDVYHDGLSGLYWAKEVDYDLIILDIMLPGRDGMRVCQELRAGGLLTPILMLTAKDGVEDTVRGLDIGADDYLTKPFSFDELLARIRALLRRTQSYKSQTLKVADLELDPVSHKVSRAGKAIALTGKEYALLEYLMRNVGRIVTETNIIDHVWDMQSEPFTNVVSVYIHYLRNKVDKGFQQKLIHTVRTLGYVMKAGEDDEHD
ncbi:response regulator [candidate division KSB3 bacterium]|uniref:Response regulator n=1 Tax=candidate division KSB3 bacterium TaxID=2044937 RepID=A0A9D5Q5I0_9BACT|nr:response regulator [candidate division KSB3 bacterium]MBD3324645.1 response regulator [candidate division KSB3 bacterium]